MKCPFCGERGAFAVTFSAYPLGFARVPRNKMTGHFNLELCESHKNMGKEDLLSKVGWERIQQALLSKGKALLDSASVELHFNPVK